MSDVAKGALLALIVGLQEWIRSYFNDTLHKDSLVSALLGCAFVVVTYVFLDAASHIRRIKFARRAFMQPARFEGFWISNVSDSAAPVSISKIYYRYSLNCWTHHGFGYDPEGNRIREWVVNSIHYDRPTREWFFSGKWYKHQKSGNSAETARYDEKDQISLLLTPSTANSFITSLFFDEARSAGLPTTEKIQMPRAGRAEMCLLPAKLIHQVTGRKPTKIEHISEEMAKSLIKHRDVIFNSWME